MRSRPLPLSAPIAAVALLAVLTGCAATSTGAASPSATTAADVVVEHARGTAEVPADPQRVVVLEPLELDVAVALGVTPVGAAVVNEAAGVPTYLGVDVAPVGTVVEPSLEAIAALEPDLILGTESRHSDLFAQLDSIAPTVFMATQADPWRDNARLIGTALGREDAVGELLDDVDERCAAIADGNDLAGTTATMMRPRDETTLSLYGPTSFGGSLLSCAGFTLPEHDWADGLQADISPENILQAEADYLFVTTADVDDASAIPAAVTQNPAAFPRVIPVDFGYWVSGVGPLGAQAILDDIEKTLAAQR